MKQYVINKTEKKEFEKLQLPVGLNSLLFSPSLNTNLQPAVIISCLLLSARMKLQRASMSVTNHSQPHHAKVNTCCSSWVDLSHALHIAVVGRGLTARWICASVSLLFTSHFHFPLLSQKNNKIQHSNIIDLGVTTAIILCIILLLCVSVLQERSFLLSREIKTEKYPASLRQIKDSSVLHLLPCA